MRKDLLIKDEQKRFKWLIGLAVFLITFVTFWSSPIREMTDSKYSMLASQTLLKYHTLALDRYSWPGLNTVPASGLGANTTVHQIESLNGHLFYYFPPGSSILSLPYVGLMNACGISVTKPDGSYNIEGELAIQGSLAALLMAASACLFFFISSLVLPLSWSTLIALSGALGTQVWSTASRVLWSDTWAILLLAAVVWILLAGEIGRYRYRNSSAVILATLLAWGYFVRPTNAIAIIAITIYIVLFHRKAFLPYALTGAAWLALFMLYSWHTLGALLPSYFRLNRLRFDAYGEALTGNLISPSRGLFVYVPVLLFVGYLLLRYWRHLFLKRLAVLSLIVAAGHLLIVSAFVPWYGGGCFGPRYSTGLVPWFVLLAVLGVRTMLAQRRREKLTESLRRSRAPFVAGGALLILSIFINARGAISYDTWLWNDSPINVDIKPARVWEWRYPQFLAGLIHPPLPANFPVVGEGTQVDLTSRESDQFLWFGWSGPEPGFRWTAAREATIIFALDRPSDLLLRIKAGPFLAPGKLERQVVEVRLNRQMVGTLVLSEARQKDLSLMLPAQALGGQNILSFALPEASSPRKLGVGYDERPLGIAVKSIIFERGAESNR